MTTGEAVSQLIGVALLGVVCYAMGWPWWCWLGLYFAIKMLDNQTWRDLL